MNQAVTRGGFFSKERITAGPGLTGGWFHLLH